MSVYMNRRKRPASEPIEQQRSEWPRAIEIASRELPATAAATIDDLRGIPSWPLVSQLLYAKSAKTRDLNAEALLRVVNDRPTRQEGPTKPAKRPVGRPRLTEALVRSELTHALDKLAQQKVSPSWDAIAAQHEGRTVFGMTTSALTKRKDRFPAVFRELLPHLFPEE